MAIHPLFKQFLSQVESKQFVHSYKTIHSYGKSNKIEDLVLSKSYVTLHTLP